MKKKHKILDKFLSLVTAFALIFQSLSPLLLLTPPAYAQEVSPSPEATVSPTPTPSEEPTVTPEPSAEVSPTPTAEPSPSATLEPTPAPTEQSTPTPEPTPNESPNPPPSENPTPTPSPEPVAQGDLSAIVVENTSAESVEALDLDPVEATSAQLVTDKADYAPTDTVVISGTGLKKNFTYDLVISSDGPPALLFETEITTNQDGEFVYAYQLDGIYRPLYLVELKNKAGKLIASTSFTDANPSADLDQCGNGSLSSPNVPACNPDEWVNGNLGASKSHYFEGDSVPYRMKFSNLGIGVSNPHTVTIEWDTTKSSKHALDFLTSFDRTITTANPCAGVGGCDPAVFTTFAIPADSQVTGAGVTPVAGNFTLFGGTITAVSGYSYPDDVGFTGDKSARLTITFTASVDNPVLAWGGHISNRTDWGSENSAVSIPGSPYHMRLIGLDGQGGNQDRSLSADAVIFPASITIIKDSVPNHAQDFGFTTTGGLTPTPFSLDDDSDSTLSNTKLYSDLLVTNNTGNNYTVIEGAVSGWTLSFNSPVCTVTSANGGSQSDDVSTRTVSINLREGENVSCTFINTLQQGNIKIIKNTTGGDGSFDFTISGPTPSTPNIATSGGTGDTGLIPVDSGTYSVSETVPDGWDLTSSSCDSGTPASFEVPPGGTVTCTFNDSKLPTLTVNKVLIPSDDTGTFNLQIDGSTVGTGATVGNGGTTGPVIVSIGSHTVGETAGPSTNLSDYTTVIGGDCASDGTVELAAGENKTCTITNTKLGSISGYKFEDEDGDLNTTDDQNPVVGWIIELWSCITDFSISNCTDTGQTATTDISGFFSFENLLPGLYKLVEQIQTGWTNLTSSSVNVTLDPGEEDTDNNFVNTQYGKIIIDKVTDPQGSQQFAFTLTGGPSELDQSFSLQDGDSHDSGDILPGSGYNASEAVPSGWDLTSATCDDGSPVNNITVSSDETVTCTFTNTQRGHIIIIKDVIGNPDPQDFTFHNNFENENPDTFMLDEDNNDTLPSSRDFEVLPGTYAVSEDPVEGWQSPESTSCNSGETVDSIDVGPGETITCTFVNEELINITLVKNTIGGDGTFDFNMTGSGLPASTQLTTIANTDSETFIGLDQDNAYSITEVVPDGWDLTSATCTGGETPAVITPEPGEDITCTFTNGKLPTLTLEKTVVNDNGGTAQENDFQGYINGEEVDWDDTQTLNPGSYTASEDGVAGYSAGDWGGDCAADGTITLAYGDEAVCTITNDDDAPSLTLVKEVIKDDGGDASESDWTLIATGPTGFSGSGPSVSNGPSFDVGIYDLSELGPDGYTASDWVCVGGSQTDGDTVEIGLGEDVTCTITNNDIAPTLRLVKEVTNDNGGTAESGDWELTADGDENGFTDFGDSITFHTVTAGVGYSLSESEVFGYSPGSWSCDAEGVLVGDVVTLGLDQDVVCTITNDDIQPQLTVIKHVINDNGGNAQASDFGMVVLGVGVSNPFFPGDEAGTTVYLNQGSYFVGEFELPGYSMSSSVDCVGSIEVGETKTCTITNDDIAPQIVLSKNVINNNGGTALPDDFDLTIDGSVVGSGTTNPVSANTDLPIDETVLGGYEFVSITGDEKCPQVLEGTVNLDEGEVIGCTITNDDLAPSLTLVKHITNDNGGTAQSSDWFLTADGPTGIGGSGPSVSSGPTFSAGTYTLSESGPSDYTASSWECEGGQQSGNQVTLGLDEDVTCEITNNDDAPSLTLVKEVINDNGGDAVASDWTLTATGPTEFVGIGPSVTSGPSFDQGTYDLSEAGPDGYTASDWVCVGGSQTDGDTVEVGLGEDVTCTITNDDKTAKITLIKEIINDDGGLALPDDFDPTIDGVVVLSGSTTDVDSNIAHSINETLVDGYEFVSITGEGCTSSLGESVTLDEGEEIICTITNNDLPGHLIVHKITDPSSDTTTQFSITASGPDVHGDATQSITGGGSVDYIVDAGTYSVSEADIAGWDETSNDCVNIEVANGETEECTITNTKQGKITVVKDATPNDAQDFEFTFTGQNNFFLDDDTGVQDPPGTNQPQSVTFDNLPANAPYTAGEILPAFWEFQGVSCVNDNDQSPYTNIVVSGTGVTITLDPGAEVTCTFNNFKPGPTRTQGFWQTHTSFTSTIFAANFPTGMVIGSLPHRGTITNTLIPNQSELFGAYYSSISMKSIGKGKNFKRSAVDQARMILLQQLVTAKLNCAAFGCSLAIQSAITAADTAYFLGDIAGMQLYTGILDAYNNSGDTIIISPPLPSPGKATPKTSQSYADLAFWNNP